MQTEIRIEAKRSARPTRGLEVFRTVLTRATRPVPQETIDSAFAAQSFTRLYQRLFQYQDEIDEVEGVGSVGLAEVAHYLASAALLDWPHHSSLPVPRARPMRLARRRPLSVLHRELCLALDAAPVEDGMRHPGEEILQGYQVLPPRNGHMVVVPDFPRNDRVDRRVYSPARRSSSGVTQFFARRACDAGSCWSRC